MFLRDLPLFLQRREHFCCDMTGQVPRRPGPGRPLTAVTREDVQKNLNRFVGFCCNLSNLMVMLRRRGRPEGGPKRLIGRMIAMKRLPALMLSVFLLTLLSLPATAESVTENNQSVSKSVALKVNASDMVDVTITWDDFEYNYNGRTFSTKDNTITVKNNNPQNNILVTPTFVKRDGLAYSDDAFYIYFYGEEG